MAIKKSELYSSLWKSCDQLRGGMDASQYKDYILILLFVKYVSDKAKADPDALIEVPEGGSFDDMVRLKETTGIGDNINKIIGKLADANGLKGVIDVADFNDPDKLGRGNDMVDRLSKLVAVFQNPGLDFSRNRAENDDILGDAYEYLMRNFATESGKSKGQFYTPAEVSRVMAKLIGIGQSTSIDQTLYDPTCGSGSLLLKAADEAPHGITIYGQEMDNSTAALARMNMILHNNGTADIYQGNTLSDPHFKTEAGTLQTFDYIVANPPFSSKAWSTGLKPETDLYGRFTIGAPPEKNGDYAFLLHILTSLKSRGKGAVILPHGVLFRGNAEGDIRKTLIRRGYIKAIIGLAPNLFYGTGIPACIIVLDKENAESRRGIFMIDASRQFVKDGNKNRLREQDIRKIVDVYTAQRTEAKFSRMVPVAEIEANDFNLNIPRYIDAQEPEDVQDIEAHLLGGIPTPDIAALRAYWDVCPTLAKDLFTDEIRPNYRALNVPAAQIRPTIYEHPEFVAYRQRTHATFERWRTKHVPTLKSLTVGLKPKPLIEALGDDLLTTFADTYLIDKYDTYQHLMSYWLDTMQDDTYLIAADGWVAQPVFKLKKDGKPSDEWECDLVPKRYVVARYFGAEQQQLDQLEAEAEGLTRQRDELDEEHGGDDGLFAQADVLTDKGGVDKKVLAKRVKELQKARSGGPEQKEIFADEAAKQEAADELAVLATYLKLLDDEETARKKVKQARADLDRAALKKYADLTTDEVKTLVVDDKWTVALSAAMTGELERISQQLTRRIVELADRYDTPLPQLTATTDALTATVDAHLQKMGFAWS
jgi:type I restriction enzyme M protein